MLRSKKKALETQTITIKSMSNVKTNTQTLNGACVFAIFGDSNCFFSHALIFHPHCVCVYALHVRAISLTLRSDVFNSIIHLTNKTFRKHIIRRNNHRLSFNNLISNNFLLFPSYYLCLCSLTCVFFSLSFVFLLCQRACLNRWNDRVEPQV